MAAGYQIIWNPTKPTKYPSHSPQQVFTSNRHLDNLSTDSRAQLCQILALQLRNFMTKYLLWRTSPEALVGEVFHQLLFSHLWNRDKFFPHRVVGRIKWVTLCNALPNSAWHEFLSYSKVLFLRNISFQRAHGALFRLCIYTDLCSIKWDLKQPEQEKYKDSPQWAENLFSADLSLYWGQWLPRTASSLGVLPQYHVLTILSIPGCISMPIKNRHVKRAHNDVSILLTWLVMHHSKEGDRQLCFWNETSGRIQPCTQEVGWAGDREVKGRGLNHRTDLQCNEFCKQYPWCFQKKKTTHKKEKTKNAEEAVTPQRTLKDRAWALPSAHTRAPFVFKHWGSRAHQI